MRLGEWQAEIRDRADLTCTACGMWHDSRIGNTSNWRRFADGTWWHWCAGGWSPGKEKDDAEQ